MKKKICDSENHWLLILEKYIKMRLNSGPVQLYNWLNTNWIHFKIIHPFIQLIGFLVSQLDVLIFWLWTEVWLCLNYSIRIYNDVQWRRIIEIPIRHWWRMLEWHYVNLNQEIFLSVYNYCISIMSIKVLLQLNDDYKTNDNLNNADKRMNSITIGNVTKKYNLALSEFGDW